MMLMTLSANPGTHANLTHSFLASGVVPVQKPESEATEDIRIHLVLCFTNSPVFG